MSFIDLPHCKECGLTLKPSTTGFEEGTLVDGRYRLMRPLGSGGMGEVFDARDVHLHRNVAVKVLRAASSKRSLEAFHSEASALASIKHPHIPPVHSFGVHGASPFFVMELIEGNTLAQVIEAHARHRDRIPIHPATTLLRQICSALGAAHAAGILHRDIKPENVIIEAESGRPMLVDFGIATRLASEAPLEVVGTPAFMAPEAFSGEGTTVASDVYSLGCLAYEVFTGRVPFDGETIDQLRLSHLGETPVGPVHLSPGRRAVRQRDPSRARQGSGRPIPDLRVVSRRDRACA